MFLRGSALKSWMFLVFCELHRLDQNDKGGQEWSHFYDANVDRKVGERNNQVCVHACKMWWHCLLAREKGVWCVVVCTPSRRRIQKRESLCAQQVSPVVWCLYVNTFVFTSSLIFVSYVWQQSFLATCSMYWFALYCNFDAFSNCVCCQQYVDVCQCIQQSPNIHQVANWILAIEQRDLLEALLCVLLLFF